LIDGQRGQKRQAEGVFEGEVLYSFFINRKALTACSGKGDVMTNHDCIELLAELLDVERLAAGSLLTGFSNAIVAELLAVRKLSLKGLGSFTVNHIPAAKKSTASSIIYTPPCNRLTFSPKMSGADDSVRLAVSRLSMSQADAEHFARSLSTLFSGAFQQQREIHLNGLGRFALEQGVYSFFPEHSIEELLNREYQDLEEVVLPQHQQRSDKGERKKLRYILPLSALMIAGVLIVVLNNRYPASVFFASLVKQPENLASAVGQKSPEMAATLSAQVLHPDPSSAGGTDSLVLEKDDFTIILASFRKESTVRQERLRFASKGVIAFVCPPVVRKTKYYRLMTGRFASRHEASERFRQLPEKTARNSYIHQVIERVVLHGEKGL
jgi:nucleoid DNA-binding protein